MNVLIINGHPGKDTFNHALANAFKKGAQKTSVSLKTIEVNDMKLRLDMTGFNKEKAIPENILKAQGMIAWADHLVWIYPTWWSTMPAMLKAFFEQVFISGFAFEYKQSTQVVKWDKFLKGKSAQIISTMDSPPWYYKLFVGDPGFKTVKDIMNFCGIKPVKRTYFGSVKVSTEKQRQKWLDKAEQLGRKLK